MNDAIIQVENLSVIKNNNLILDNISFDVLKNDFVTIVGPNGAGKSTLLQCIIKLFAPSSGSITFNKQYKIGYMPQKLPLNHMMPISVKRFLTIGNKVNKDLFQSIVAKSDISLLLDSPLYSLSGGQMQRVLIARALMKQPDILILDEPTQNLDIEGQLLFYKLLEDIYNKSKISILMVSHDLHFVMRSSTKVICLFKHICCLGKPKTVAEDPDFIKIFGKEMANLLKVYKHNEAHATHHH